VDSMADAFRPKIVTMVERWQGHIERTDGPELVTVSMVATEFHCRRSC
jgi:hypothetical protein